MDTKVFEVLRAHQGDRWYDVGGTRTARAADVAHLVDRGVLRDAKAAPAPKNKAEPAPKNKKA